MASDARLSPQEWRPWAVQVPAALATAVCSFLGTIGWLYVEMLGGYNCALTDGPPPPGCGGGTDWWLAIPLAIGWFALCLSSSQL